MVRELYIYVSHSMLCYGLYFINMKMVFPVVQLCLTPPLLLGIFRQIRLLDIFIIILSYQHSKVSYKRLLQATHLRKGQSEGGGRDFLWLLVARLEW